MVLWHYSLERCSGDSVGSLYSVVHADEVIVSSSPLEVLVDRLKVHIERLSSEVSVSMCYGGVSSVEADAFDKAYFG